MSKVVLVAGSDWQGLYIDGGLKRQGHTLHSDVILDALGIDYEYIRITGDGHWAAWGGNLPPRLTTVKKDLARGWPG